MTLKHRKRRVLFRSYDLEYGSFTYRTHKFKHALSNECWKFRGKTQREHYSCIQSLKKMHEFDIRSRFVIGVIRQLLNRQPHQWGVQLIRTLICTRRLLSTR